MKKQYNRRCNLLELGLRVKNKVRIVHVNFLELHITGVYSIIVNSKFHRLMSSSSYILLDNLKSKWSDLLYR